MAEKKGTTVEIEGDVIVLRTPLDPKMSSTGKMMLIASSGGWLPTTSEYKGKPIQASFNIGIRMRG